MFLTYGYLKLLVKSNLLGLLRELHYLIKSLHSAIFNALNRAVYGSGSSKRLYFKGNFSENLRHLRFVEEDPQRCNYILRK